MKRGFLGGVGLAVVIVAGLFCIHNCTVRVPAGYIAVEYRMNGGISKDVLTQGWHVISPTVKRPCIPSGLNSLTSHLRTKVIHRKMKVLRHQPRMANHCLLILNSLTNLILIE